MDKERDVKPGWKTTEFWAMVGSAFFGILIVTGVISNTDSNTMLAYVNNIMGSGVTIVSVTAYIFSRGKTKNPSKSDEYKQLLKDIEIYPSRQKFSCINC